MAKRIMFLIGILCFLCAGTAFAETFKVQHCIYVSEDSNGVVTVKGEPVDIKEINMLIQFSPDKFKAGSPDNRYISPLSKTEKVVKFQMNLSSAKNGQRAFNLKSGRLWLRIPHRLVAVGANLILELSQPSPDSEDGHGGAHFVFTSAIK